MPPYALVIILAVAGALCLALAAAAGRRLPGGWRWTGLRPGEDDSKDRYARELMMRELLLRLLRRRFGDLPPAVVARVQSGDLEWCEEVAVRLLTATSLEELGL